MLYICIRNEKSRLFIIMTKKFYYILFGVILLLTVGLTVYSITLSHKLKNVLSQAPTVISVTDTITNWEHDTMYFHSYIKDTLALTDTAIIYDTITNTQYVEVSVPIYSYYFDTSIVIKHPYYSNFSYVNDSLIVGISQTVRGYKVELVNTILDVKGTLAPAQLQPQKKIRVVPAVGLGYGTGGWGAFCGVGLSYW